MTRFHFGTLRHEILHAQEHVVEYDWIAWISPLYPPFSSHSDLPDAVPSTRISLDLFGTNLVSGERYDDGGKNKVVETVRKGWIRLT